MEAVKNASFEKKQLIDALKKDVKLLDTKLAELDKQAVLFKDDPVLSQAMLARIEATSNERTDKLKRINDLEIEVKQGQHAAKQLKDEQDSGEIGPLMQRFNMGYSIRDQRYISFKNSSDNITVVCNPQPLLFTHEQMVDELSLISGKKITLDKEALKDVFRADDRIYTAMVTSFKIDRWGKSFYNVARVLKDTFWVQPDNTEPYNELFDHLIYSVAGGKQENVQHLEKWIVHKHKFPERSESTPNLDLMGAGGGNGKNLFKDMLETIFAGGCVVPIGQKDLENGFNSMLENATIGFIDENEGKSFSADAYKRATGSTNFRLEKKGKDAIAADANYNLLCASNNGLKGSIPVDGSGTSGADRRTSVIHTNIRLKERLQDVYECNIDTASELTHEIALLVKNREEVAKFLTHLFSKHGADLNGVLLALHGEDYQEQVKAQRSDINTLYDAIIKYAVNDGCIPLKLVHRIVNACVDKPMKVSEVKEQFSNALMLNGYKSQCEKQYFENYWGDEKGAAKDQAQVWILDKSGVLNVNYKQYLSHKPVAGKKSWSDDLLIGEHLAEELRQYRQV
ncbi:primase-helicase family protein [Burkholderia guangdongensis]|uniref:primase-helicase family protein n=1 Tax=Burkholderia guangdongensis TaxID=1792500 RepID=UPI0015C7D31C|nr:DUF5906 domain-containing protein [Burkholderia guangdongensis]